MKLAKKREAIKLRKKGVAMRDIANLLKVSKASVSLWVRDIELSKKQIQRLQGKPHSKIAIERRRDSRLKNEEMKRNVVRDEARMSVTAIPSKSLFYIGLALYWAEGTKTKRGVVEFTNSDPQMIKLMMRFFTDTCNIPDEKFRGHVFLHEHLSVKRAEKYWSQISGIPLNQFHKTSIQLNRNRIAKDTLPMGTFAIIICDTVFRLKISGWTEGMCDRLLI